jgi:hypothetical protein
MNLYDEFFSIQDRVDISELEENDEDRESA